MSLFPGALTTHDRTNKLRKREKSGRLEAHPVNKAQT